jgi:glycosyltransferase involved in cell wall biosynthesis
MKILHVPFHFFPDAVGGTEIYVSSLAKELMRRNIDSEIAAPDTENARYRHDGLCVHRFRVSDEIDDVGRLYDEGDEDAAAGFGSILDSVCPDIVHLHALNRGVSVRTLHEAKKRRISVAFTYHIPGVTCPRGTLLRYGHEICDGRWDLRTCTGCTLHSLGAPEPLSRAAARIPVAIGRMLASTRKSGRMWTALRMTDLQSQRQRLLSLFLNDVDRIVTLGHWTKEVLVANGIPERKIVTSLHGIAFSNGDPLSGRDGQEAAGLPVKMVFLGRLYSMKGLHITVQAIRHARQLPVTLDIFGVIQDEESRNYRRRLEALAAGDSRIRFCEPVPPADVLRCLQAYDVMAVPSLWLETGPLVILEAFAAGLPVIGSNLGGIAELVEHNTNGLLVEPDSQAWHTTLQQVCQSPETLRRLRRGVRPPRTIAMVADDMIDMYHDMLRSNRTTTPLLSSTETR